MNFFLGPGSLLTSAFSIVPYRRADNRSIAASSTSVAFGKAERMNWSGRPIVDPSSSHRGDAGPRPSILRQIVKSPPPPPFRQRPDRQFCDDEILARAGSVRQIPLRESGAEAIVACGLAPAAARPRIMSSVSLVLVPRTPFCRSAAC